jgi:phosphopantothenoylcysteine decarboxylase/phosphopantothenate--cysteine ligase
MEKRGPHPTLRIKGTKSHSLLGYKIVLGVTGSIAAVKTVELARELIRYGAEVYGVMSDAAKEIIHPYTLHYATGHEVITKLMGNIEHVEFLGMERSADLFIIAPCTANTLNKIACGISDTTVTTFAATAFGSGIPIMVVPAMHETMYESPVLRENVRKLEELGVAIVGPKIEEGKAKIAETADIVLNVEHMLSPKKLRGKRVLITSGPTMEHIDPIRIITNRSSGRTGIEIAKEAYKRGAEVTLIHNRTLDLIGIKEIGVETTKEMMDACINELHQGYDVFISAAAISDFTVTPSNTKLRSEKDVYLHLAPAGKLIDDVRKKFPGITIVGFKAETNISKDELLMRAGEKMDKSDLDMMVANDVGKGGMGTEDNEVYIIRNRRREGKRGKRGETEEDFMPVHVKGAKKIIAEEIVAQLSDMLNYAINDFKK